MPLSLCSRLALLAAVLLAASTASADAARAAPTTSILTEWKFVEWAGLSAADHDRYYSTEAYKLNLPVTLRLHPTRDDVRFVSLPRLKDDVWVPATIAVMYADDVNATTGNPFMRGFPSYAANDPDAEDGIRSSFGMEVDPYGRMYVLDNGRVGTVGKTPQLVIYDVSDLQNVKLLRRHKFNSDVASSDKSFLNDLVIDVATMKVYITDSSNPTKGQDGAIIVYDYFTDTATRVLSATKYTKPAVPILDLTINGIPFPGFQAGADGIALSPDGKVLFFVPLTSHQLFAIRTADLLKPDAESRVSVAAHKKFCADGIAIDSTGRVYLTDIDHSSVQTGTYNQNVGESGDIILSPLFELAHNNETMMWPDTVGFDFHGHAQFLTNGPIHFPKSIDFSNVNFRVFRVHTDEPRYSYMANMTDGLTNHKTPTHHHHPHTLAIVLTVIIVGIFLGGGAFVVLRRRNTRPTSATGTESLMQSQSDVYGETRYEALENQ